MYFTFRRDTKPMSGLTEDHLAIATLDWFKSLGYSIAHGPDIAADGKAPERATYGGVALKTCH